MADDSRSEDCSICFGFVEGVSVVEAAGEVDMADLSLLAKALGEATDSGYGDVLLDAQQLTYIDGACLQTLLSCSQRLAQQGRKLAILGCHGVFRKLINESHLQLQLPVYADLNEALSSLR